MKPRFSPLFRSSTLGFTVAVALVSGAASRASAELIAPEISITAPADMRVVQGTALQPLNFSAQNLNSGSDTTFDLELTTGSVGQINSLRQPDPAVQPSGIRVNNAPATTPWNGVTLKPANTGTISATPNIASLNAGQTMNFGIKASNANWDASVSASSNINVVTNRLLSGTTTINAGRHMAYVQSIGSLILNGGTWTDNEATRISVNSGGYAQLANGLRLTSASNFTFNSANQTHDLQVAYYGPTGNYNINTALPGEGASNYTDLSNNKHQEFGGAWKTSAEYGNVFGDKRVFTDAGNGLANAPGSNQPWLRPDGPPQPDGQHYAGVYKQELATTPQPVIPQNLPYDYGNATGVETNWELSRGAGPLVNERINPLITGEVIQGSNLDLSGVSLTVTGTAVTDRRISGGTIDLGRRMVGAANQTISRNDTVTLTTSGSNEHRTRLNLSDFSLGNGGAVTADHLGNTAFTDGAHTATVQLTGNFTASSATQGRQFQGVNAGSSIIGEGLEGETKQTNLQLGYTWNNVENNQLRADNLLVLESNTASGTRSYGTYVDRVFNTETHTNIGWTGNNVTVNGTRAAGLYNLGNTTVSAVAEGLAGETVSGPVTFNTQVASIASASFTLGHNGQAGGPLTDGNVITLRDTGSGIFQNNVQIGNVAISGGERLDYQLNYAGGGSLLNHGTNRTFTIDFIGNSNTPLAGQMSRVSRANLSVNLSGEINYNAIRSAWGQNGSVYHSYGGDDLGSHVFQLETRFDAPAAASGTSQVAAGGDLGVNGLALKNTSANTSTDRFTKATDLELLDSKTLTSATTVQVSFVSLTSADPTLVDALEDDSKNAASRAGIYGGDTNVAFASDIVNLTGLDGVLQVVQVGYDDTDVTGEEGAQLLWRYDYTGEGGSAQIAWINAVLGNSNITDLDLDAGTLTVDGSSGTIQDYLESTRFNGSYADYLADNNLTDSDLGAWGLDLETDKVWAVIDHNSSFVASVPEPSMSLLVIFGFGGLAFRRSRKN